jgi:CDP-diacylglycerol--glycerol-3-phosphate 3-phosphatidyltransferase
MLGVNGRDVARVVFTPPARVLVRLHVTADMVTITGTVLVMSAALWLLPTGRLWLGALVIGALVCTDALDGTMARLENHSTSWGAFLDSTLDRVSDGAVFAGLVVFFARGSDLVGVCSSLAALVLGTLVPYARARAEGLGLWATLGIAERSDRLIVCLGAAFVSGVGASLWVLKGALIVLSLAALVTVLQRARAVWVQGASTPPPIPPARPAAYGAKR